MNRHLLAVARAAIDPKPTDGQKHAGNYAKGHIRVHGLDVTLENRKGSTRSGIDPDGKRWSCTLPADYGYVRGTEGADGDQVDVYIGPRHSSRMAFVVNQIDHRTRRFDEHKIMLGYESERDAVADYCRAFSDGKGRERIGSVEAMSVDALKHWLRHGRTTKKASGSDIIERALQLARPTRKSHHLSPA